MPSGAIAELDPKFDLPCYDFASLISVVGPLLSASQTVLPGSRGGMIRGSFCFSSCAVQFSIPHSALKWVPDLMPSGFELEMP
jgi:hypothetical protein